MRKKRVLNLNTSPLESKKYFKPIFVSIDNMDKFEEKEVMKERIFTKNTWYDWLINYIPEPIKKTMGGLKDQTISLFKTNPT